MDELRVELKGLHREAREDDVLALRFCQTSCHTVHRIRVGVGLRSSEEGDGRRERG